MNDTHQRIVSSVDGATADWAPVPVIVTGDAGQQTIALSTVADGGHVRLGGQAPMFLPAGIADAGQVAIGGQAPMFLPDAIADAGLVRLGGQSPAF